ncbi:MAG: dephospho-CoA kinase, partial [Deltaproteobacteria bacterium]
MVVGLTGGIACGKSLVSGELRRLGAHIVDADVISREITAKGSPVYDEIVRGFGRGVVRPDGSIDRKALGAIVFSDREKLLKLNAVTHPAIIKTASEKIERIKKSHPGAVIVVDAPLLIETGMHRAMDRVVVVYADEEKLIERMKKRDGLDEREAKERLSHQMPIKEKIKYADYLIENNGT